MASDKFGAKMTLFVAMIVWSLFSGALVLAVGFVSMIVIRVLFGMGEGRYQPPLIRWSITGFRRTNVLPLSD